MGRRAQTSEIWIIMCCLHPQVRLLRHLSIFVTVYFVIYSITDLARPVFGNNMFKSY